MLLGQCVGVANGFSGGLLGCTRSNQAWHGSTSRFGVGSCDTRRLIDVTIDLGVTRLTHSHNSIEEHLENGVKIVNQCSDSLARAPESSGGDKFQNECAGAIRLGVMIL